MSSLVHPETAAAIVAGVAVGLSAWGVFASLSAVRAVFNAVTGSDD